MPKPKTDAEKRILIQKFREKSSKYVFDPYWNSDACIEKWLEFKLWNVERAEKALRKCLEWRDKLDLETILDEKFDDLQENLVYYMDGFDNDGRPVLTVPMNECYIRNEVDSGNKERVKRFMCFIVESLLNKIKTEYLANPDNNVSQFVVILDATGIEVRDIPPKVISTLVETARLIEDNYPGLLNIGYVINATKAAKQMFNFNKSILNHKTLDLCHVYGEKREKWLPKVLKNIQPDQLRERFGGTRPNEPTEGQPNENGASFEKTVERLNEMKDDKELTKEFKKEFKAMKKEFKEFNKEVLKNNK